MSIIVRPNSYSAGGTILSAQVNSDFNTIYSDYNGGITTANLSASAAIVDTQLAQITTQGKVSTAALVIGSQATGDLIYAGSATTWSRLGIGTSSQVLIGGTTPSWGAVPTPSGATVQVVNTSSGASATGTTAIPNDDTIPQVGEGTSFITRAITPNNASNLLLIIAQLNFGLSTNDTDVTAALFQDASSNALAAIRSSVQSANQDMTAVTLVYYMTAGTTSSTTFSIRAGTNGGATVSLNGFGGARKLGGVLISSLTVMEIKA